MKPILRLALRGTRLLSSSVYRLSRHSALPSLGWTTDELRGRRKNDPQKVRIASRLRREATMTLEWIAERL
jgi:hypothetical protein